MEQALSRVPRSAKDKIIHILHMTRKHMAGDGAFLEEGGSAVNGDLLKKEARRAGVQNTGPCFKPSWAII
eukprot:8927895-Prorocentrum_lima.AAC.1